VTPSTDQWVNLPLGQVQADTNYQPRMARLDPDRLERLRGSDPTQWPPLLVSPNDAGGYDVIDGFHRLHIAHEREFTTIRCAVIPGAGYPEAVAANLTHGLPLAVKDRKTFAVWLHEQEPSLSLRELARRSGLSDKTVKAALDYAEFPQSDDAAASLAARPSPDPIVRVVRLACAAITDGVGVNKFAQFFSGKTDQQQRAAYVSRVLATYSDDERRDVATALVTLGTALIDGVRAYQPHTRHTR
jgi:ParB-like nuclease domain